MSIFCHIEEGRRHSSPTRPLGIFSDFAAELLPLYLKGGLSGIKSCGNPKIYPLAEELASDTSDSISDDEFKKRAVTLDERGHLQEQDFDGLTPQQLVAEKRQFEDAVLSALEAKELTQLNSLSQKDSLVARLDLLMIATAGLHHFGWQELPEKLDTAIQEVSKKLGMPPSLTYEDIILNNPENDWRTFTDGAVGNSEINFYRGHVAIEDTLTDVIQLLKTLNRDTDTEILSDILRQADASLAPAADIMCQYSKDFSAEDFQEFRHFFSTNPIDGSPGASGRFALQYQHLRVLTDGDKLDQLIPRLFPELDENWDFYPEQHKEAFLQDVSRLDENLSGNGQRFQQSRASECTADNTNDLPLGMLVHDRGFPEGALDSLNGIRASMDRFVRNHMRAAVVNITNQSKSLDKAMSSPQVGSITKYLGDRIGKLTMAGQDDAWQEYWQRTLLPSFDMKSWYQQQNRPLKLLFLGDSYTEATGEDLQFGYPQQLAHELAKQGYETEITVLAQDGWTSGELKQALEDDQSSLDLNGYDAVMLCVGVNDVFRGLEEEQFVTNVASICATAQQAGGENAKLSVLSIPPWDVTPSAEDAETLAYRADKYPAVAEQGERFNCRSGIIATIDSFNQCLKDFIDGEHDQQTVFVDVTTPTRELVSINTEQDLVTSDNIHFNRAVYQAWATQQLDYI